MNTHTMPNHDEELQPIPDWPAQRANRPANSSEAVMAHRVNWTALYAALSEPFEPSLIRYRAGATNREKTQAQALPYVDPRTYEDRLNQLVPGNWEVTFEPWGNDRIICRLTIHNVTRSSTGEASDCPDGIAGTSAEAQAFKRACTKFGLGRHLYTVSPRWAPYDATTGRLNQKPIDSPQPAAPTGSQPAIGHDRARRLIAALQELGMADAAQLRLATRLFARPVTNLALLTEAEATLLWRAARSTARTRPQTPQATLRDPGQPWTSEKGLR